MRQEPDFEQYHHLFAENYHATNYGRSLAGVLMLQGHIAAERAFGKAQHFSRVLELGSGSGVHLGYVNHSFDYYLMTDDSEEMLTQLHFTASGDVRSDRIAVRQINARQPKLQGEKFDRIIATHVLEHLSEPHQVLREWFDLLQPDGVLTLLQPCDPGLAWRIGRMLGPRRTAEKIGIPYDYWMAREHINSIFNIRALIKYYFKNISESWYPFHLPSPDLNLFYVCHIQKREQPPDQLGSANTNSI